jgi:hypothetical protein
LAWSEPSDPIALEAEIPDSAEAAPETSPDRAKISLLTLITSLPDLSRADIIGVLPQLIREAALDSVRLRRVAELAVRARAWPEAEPLFAALVARDGRDTDSRLQLARAHAALGDQDLAAFHARECLAMASASAGVEALRLLTSALWKLDILPRDLVGPVRRYTAEPRLLPAALAPLGDSWRQMVLASCVLRCVDAAARETLVAPLGPHVPMWFGVAFEREVQGRFAEAAIGYDLVGRMGVAADDARDGVARMAEALANMAVAEGGLEAAPPQAGSPAILFLLDAPACAAPAADRAARSLAAGGNLSLASLVADFVWRATPEGASLASEMAARLDAAGEARASRFWSRREAQRR